MKYKVVLNESEEGFSVSCPGLPGCWSQGATEEEALENIQDAITEYLATTCHSRLGSSVIDTNDRVR
jgi:predicted RNase H-like HicB family nuclease